MLTFEATRTSNLSDNSVVCAVRVLLLSSSLSAQIYKEVINTVFNSFSFGCKWICAVFCRGVHCTAENHYAEHTAASNQFALVIVCAFVCRCVEWQNLKKFLLANLLRVGFVDLRLL